MSFSDKDYYQILGISPDASSKEIKERYKKLMMENHPDRFKGLKAKYEAEGDEVLLEVLEEKIRQADEACKFINEAYKVLSDPALRKAYDEETYEPKVPVPEIVISPTEISFGALNEGQRKSKSFTIENKGGPAMVVEINWEDDPDWGELIIEPDPEETFPIKVTIKVDTTGIPSGSKTQKIFIKVNGTSHAVEVLLPVVVPKATTPSGVGVTPPLPSVGTASHPKKAPLRGLAGLLVGATLICVFVILIGAAILAAELLQEEQRQQEILENFPVEITEARRIRCVKEFPEDERLEKRVGSYTVCIVFTVENGWEDWAMVQPVENSGIHGDFYNVLVDPGAQYPCGRFDHIEPNVTETYVCFEREGVVVDTLCLEVRLDDMEGRPRNLQKTVCSDVVSIR